MILACHHISKAFGTDVILNDISFHIEDYEKAAIVGINGAGKSTLMKIIVDELSPDSGDVILAKGKTLGYLAQHHSRDSHRTIYEELLDVKKDIIALEQRMAEIELAMKDAKETELDSLLKSYARLRQSFEDQNGYAYRSEVVGVLKGLGFTEEDFNKEVHLLSGGQKTRVALGRLLLAKPDILLLDEPTNHLDMNSTAWLETFLMNYKGAVIIVAHDRYFLDKVVTKIIEIDHHEGLVFKGNYTDYAAKKAQLRDIQRKAWLNQQAEIAHQEAVIQKLRSFNREKSIKRAESREKMLDKMELVDKPFEENDGMRILLKPDTTSGNDVLFIEHLTKSFDHEYLFQDISMDIKRGERVALIGDNGAGKTTILKIINGLLPADTCELRLGAKVHIGYYDQEHQVLHDEKNIFEEISDDYPSLSNTRIRNVLAAFLFTGDDVFKQIRELSGGERGRVSLAKLMLSHANFLILDEPTNHLDIQSREILEEALQNYTGTVLYVSHDRYFINQTATRILDLTGGGLNSYTGNYDDYLEKKEHPSIDSSGGFKTVPAQDSRPGETGADSLPTKAAGKDDYLRQKEEQAKERKRQNQIKRIENRIEEIENRINKLDELLVREEIATDVEKLMEINQEHETLDEELLARMEEWESLVD
ncbi:ABC-F family ATP-binding cassette domain-containing protein [Frisingicoccus caecimuris]|uniref:ATP-binding cassette subfamily F protein 3 n=1 Tax=Frisingicoccus caecimuris TaxID=1796636 RepID=A0A4R2LFL9_9FIRM|nr:ABC-F family ATP-binding cassette domain-containing protein [Frisingicoccus caecimuris]MCR1917997.1 ABC-F family ATP-binding cassette domain-containing protein [Frisingicoccus caecimuris]TCO86451.1 ATP-binding cassette subfamily F protein 3 [Frisingicoccus caecimuris]